ncbi:Calcitonin receptor [Nibea albiflora]|uniref:Calcitonin receptor n=1 Tax=Nibea albiflora TaxID=240163 RepID=A0ACB7EL12_NIBAL|nr:Calcitonin receptor [Nibea albiflora]
MGAIEMQDEELQYNFSDISTVLGKSRHQIMAAQFECYLKIIHDPLRTEEEKVTKVCNADGQWFHHPESNRVWSNYTQCQAHTKDKRKVSCKVLAVLTQYTSMCNYFWMLCEGIYLHTLIIVAVFVGEQQLFWYYVLGWGFPIIPAITYAVARWHFFNDMCWISANTHLHYIIHGPIQVALFVNVFFLLNIVRVLITKLKETHCTESTAYLKAVRATLILIPLLGIEFIVFPWRPDGRIARAIYEFIVNIFAHFQAQTALKRKWAQWKSAWGKTGWGDMPITNNHFNYHSSSITETSRATISLEHPSDAPSEQNSHVLFKEQKNTNGQQKDSKTCSNGEVYMLNKMEASNI